VIYHSETIDPQRAIWIAELSVAASLRWFEYLSFGGTASLGVFIGTSAVLLATGGWRGFVARNSTVCALAMSLGSGWKISCACFSSAASCAAAAVSRIVKLAVMPAA
jgi:hypothetical protein